MCFKICKSSRIILGLERSDFFKSVNSININLHTQTNENHFGRWSKFRGKQRKKKMLLENSVWFNGIYFMYSACDVDCLCFNGYKA